VRYVRRHRSIDGDGNVLLTPQLNRTSARRDLTSMKRAEQ
jgi:hypothetical protein